MNKAPGASKGAARKLVRGIKRKARKLSSAEGQIRIVLAGLRGAESIAAPCRREGIAESICYSWSKEHWKSAGSVWPATRLARRLRASPMASACFARDAT